MRPGCDSGDLTLWLDEAALDEWVAAKRSSLGWHAIEFATLKWVNWSNNRRLIESIGNVSLAEAEGNYYGTLDNRPMAA